MGNYRQFQTARNTKRLVALAQQQVALSRRRNQLLARMVAEQRRQDVPPRPDRQ